MIQNCYDEIGMTDNEESIEGFDIQESCRPIPAPMKRAAPTPRPAAKQTRTKSSLQQKIQKRIFVKNRRKVKVALVFNKV